MTAPHCILLIEDDEVDRLACRRAFRSQAESYQFAEAATGREGLAMAQTQRPQCVLLDYRLPDMNGLDVLAELNAGGTPPPVIMLTGANDVAVAVEAMRAGARDYLLKDTERRYLDLLPPVVARVLQDQRVADEKRHAEAALARAHRVMTAGELAAALAHELGQPLAAISTFSEACLQLLGRERPDAAKLRGNIDQIALQAQRAGRIIRELRAFLAKGDAEKTAVDLNALARSACDLIAAEAKTRGVRLVLQLTEALPPVQAASVHLEHVIINLLQNAIEAIRGAGMSGGTVTVTTVKDADCARVSVADTGPGIGVEATRQVFDPFYTTKKEGLGMGLAISRSVVESHGGKLWIDLDKRPGATFHFTVPFPS